MDINSLLIFFKVADSLSFTKASKILGMPKSTITRKINELEDSLKHKLFIRTTRKINLTKEGSFLYEKSKKHFDALQNIESEIKSDGDISGEIRITCVIEHRGYLVDKIIDFKKTYPNVNFHLNFSNDKEDLIEESYDFAFRGGITNSDSSYAVKLYTDSLDCYINKKFFPESLRLSDLLEFNYCVMKNSILLESISGEQFKPTKKIVSNSVEFLIDFAKKEPSIVHLPARHVPNDFIKINIFKSKQSDFNIVYLNKTQNRTCRLFLEYMKTHREK